MTLRLSLPGDGDLGNSSKKPKGNSNSNFRRATPAPASRFPLPGDGRWPFLHPPPGPRFPRGWARGPGCGGVCFGGDLPHCTRAVALKPFVPPRLTPPRQLSPGGAPADTYPIKPRACVLHSSQLRPCRPLYYLSRLPRIVSAADPPGPPAPLRSPRAGPGLDFARSA